MYKSIVLFFRRHRKLKVFLLVLSGYLLHLCIEESVFAYLGAKAQAAGLVNL
jgi:hypothetical protein